MHHTRETRLRNARLALIGWLGFLVMLLLACTSQVWSAELIESVGRVTLTEGGSVSSYGTGTLVAKDERFGYVLTCAHVVDEREGKQLAVEFQGEARANATVLEQQAEADLAILRIDRPAKSCRSICWQKLELRQPVWQSGYGHKGKPPRQIWGQVTHLERGAYFCATPIARLGDSGGPVLNEKGEVVGVISATWMPDLPRATSFSKSMRAMYATPLSSNQWLKKHLPK